VPRYLSDMLSRVGTTENAGVENAGASKVKGWKSRDWKSQHQRTGMEIAEVEIVVPEGRDGKGGRNEYGKPKLPFSDIFVESSIVLVCPLKPKWVKTVNRTNVIQNDIMHLYILCAECFSVRFNTFIQLLIMFVKVS